jgi:ribonuclease HI
VEATPEERSKIGFGSDLELATTPTDWIMLNTDGAFSPVTNKGGWGVVARDNDGDLIVAETGSVSDAIDALHTETMAVLKAITIAVRLGFGRIIIATDCQNLQGPSHPLTMIWLNWVPSSVKQSSCYELSLLITILRLYRVFVINQPMH